MDHFYQVSIRILLVQELLFLVSLALETDLTMLTRASSFARPLLAPCDKSFDASEEGFIFLCSFPIWIELELLDF